MINFKLINLHHNICSDCAFYFQKEDEECGCRFPKELLKACSVAEKKEYFTKTKIYKFYEKL